MAQSRWGFIILNCTAQLSITYSSTPTAPQFFSKQHYKSSDFSTQADLSTERALEPTPRGHWSTPRPLSAWATPFEPSGIREPLEPLELLEPCRVQVHRLQCESDSSRDEFSERAMHRRTTQARMKSPCASKQSSLVHTVTLQSMTHIVAMHVGSDAGTRGVPYKNICATGRLQCHLTMQRPLKSEWMGIAIPRALHNSDS